jgi:hypothetical protein
MKITEEQRAAAIAKLESSRAKLLAAIDGVTDAQAQFTPLPDRWTILQLVEHLAISDPGLLALIRRALAAAPQPELMAEVHKRDYRFLGETKPLPRGVNKAPEALQPKSLYATLADAKAAFLKARAETIEYARTTQDDLRDHFAPHPILGMMDGFQWLVACAGHVEIHTLQIEELKQDPAFPA